MKQLCIWPLDHYHKGWLFLKTRLVLRILRDCLRNKGHGEACLWLLPNSGSCHFLGFISHQRLLEESPFWPCKKATAVALPPHHDSHVTVFFDYPPSVDCVLTSAPTSSLPVRPPKSTSLGQLANRPLHTDVLAWIQDTSSNKISLQITQITVNKSCLHSRHETSTQDEEHQMLMWDMCLFSSSLSSAPNQIIHSLRICSWFMYIRVGELLFEKNIFGMTSWKF